MQVLIDSGGLRLAAHLSRPARDPGSTPGLVLCHGLPRDPGGAATAGATYPQLAERLAEEAGWTVLTFNFRGTGASEGDFSLGGWLDDVAAAVDHLSGTEGVAGVWSAGSSTGGALAICEAAEDERVRGVATLAAPANFSRWSAGDPQRFLAAAREVGLVSDLSFPPDLGEWARQLDEIRPVAVIGKLAPRPVLVVHGTDDEVVPVDDARALAEAGPGSVELHILGGADHGLRHDPRVVALLLDWLDRQAASAPPPG